MHANTARGKFHVKSRQSSKVTHHSHLEDTEEMGGTCCALPMMFMGIYAVLTTLVIAALSFFLHQCSGSSSHTGISGAGAGVGCVDFMNVDISFF